VLIAGVVAAKKAISRFIAVTISSTAVLNVTMIMLCLAEIVFTATIARRDRLTYTLIWGGGESAKIMGHERDRALRAQSAALVSCLEFTRASFVAS
jgi:hypothetical protein